MTDLTAVLADPGADRHWGIGLRVQQPSVRGPRLRPACDGTVPSTTIDVVRNAQQVDGSWSFNGDNTGSDGWRGHDRARRAGARRRGVRPATRPRREPGARLPRRRSSSPTVGGATASPTNPNTTVSRCSALAAGGRHCAPGCGRRVPPRTAAVGRTDREPVRLGYRPNTFATSQAIQALVRIAVPHAPVLVAPVTVPASAGGGAVTVETDSGTLRGRGRRRPCDAARST